MVTTLTEYRNGSPNEYYGDQDNYLWPNNAAEKSLLLFKKL